MTKKASAVESAESQEEQVVLETTAENNEVESIQEEIESVDDIVEEEPKQETLEPESIGLPKPKDPKPTAEAKIGLPKPREPKSKTAETLEINDGAEGDAGQTNLNEIPVNFEDVSAQVSEDELVYIDSDIKLQNILVDLKSIEENDISFTKNEDLSVTIVHIEQAIKQIGKLRK